MSKFTREKIVDACVQTMFATKHCNPDVFFARFQKAVAMYNHNKGDGAQLIALLKATEVQFPGLLNRALGHVSKNDKMDYNGGLAGLIGGLVMLKM